MISITVISHWTVAKGVYVVLSMELRDLIVGLCAELRAPVYQKAKKN